MNALFGSTVKVAMKINAGEGTTENLAMLFRYRQLAHTLLRNSGVQFRFHTPSKAIPRNRPLICKSCKKMIAKLGVIWPINMRLKTHAIDPETPRCKDAPGHLMRRGVGRLGAKLPRPLLPLRLHCAVIGTPSKRRGGFCIKPKLLMKLLCLQTLVQCNFSKENSRLNRLRIYLSTLPTRKTLTS